MPMFSAMARTTVGPAPVNSPAAPSSFTILPSVPAESHRQRQQLRSGHEGRWRGSFVVQGQNPFMTSCMPLIVYFQEVFRAV